MSKTFMEAIEQCSKESTQAGKLEAIKDIKQHHQRLIHEALNKHRRFNVRDWPEPKHNKKDYPILIPFYDLLDALANRTVTGNAARLAVSKTLGMYTKKTAGYLARVLLKDLDCGAEAKTFLKVYPEIDLPDFQVMLAKKVDEKYKWKFPAQAEIKYDGHRVVAFSNEEVVTYVARGGRPADWCNGLFDADMKRIERAYGQPVAVDGEVLGNNFQETGQAKGEKNKEQKENLRFYAFDIMPLSEWTNRKCKTSQKERTYALNMALSDAAAVKVYASDSRVVRSVQEATKFFHDVTKDGVPGKDEGLIIKDPDGQYEWGRAKAWAKWKPVNTYDLTVLRAVEGKGKFKGTLGALECEGEDENGRKIEGSVGGGFSDKERDTFWKMRSEIAGLVIECAADKMTKAKNSDAWALRFPRFVKVRMDKTH